MKRSIAKIITLLAIILFTSSCAWPGAVLAVLAGGSKGGGGGLLLPLTGGSTGAATLDKLEVSAASPKIAKGTSTQMTATAIYSDGSTQTVTSSSSWSSSNTTVLVLNSTGIADSSAAVTTGISTVTAVYSGLTASTQVEVTSAQLKALEVTPSNSTVAAGNTIQFTATGVFTDNTTQDLTAQVSWTSSTGGTATINTAGFASTLAAGTTTISAVYTGSATLNTPSAGTGTTPLNVTSATLVSISVTPSSPTIAKGYTLQFAATGNYSDGSTQNLTSSVVWTESDPAIAVVGATGLADSSIVNSGGSTGAVTITATLGAKSGTASLNVTAATLVSISVTPVNPSIAKGYTKQFTATGTYSDGSTQNITTAVSWSSSDNTIAKVSNTAGSNGLANSDPLVSGVNTGTVTITAASGAVSGSTNLTVTSAVLTGIQVTPANPSIALGLPLQFTATGIYSDGTNQNITNSVTWNSLTVAIATISNAAGSKGLATTVASGSTMVTAVSGGISGSTTLTVTAATLTSIQVIPVSSTIAKGLTVQFTATGIYTDGSNQNLTTSVTWSSSNNLVATISNAAGTNGLASSLTGSPDTGTITVTAASGAITGTAGLTVNNAILQSITVTPGTATIAKGLNQNFTATGNYSDSTTQNLTASVTWTESSAGVTASISNAAGTQGQATALATGTTTVTATSGLVSGNASLTVTAALLTSIQVTPVTPSVPKGLTQQMTATGVYTDGSTQNLTPSVTWSSGTVTVANVSNAAGSEGLVNAIATGNSLITAVSGAVSGSTTVTVTTAVLQSITVTPANASLPEKLTQQYSATGNYSDGSTTNLTTQVTWASTVTAYATVSNVSGSQGLVTAGIPGATTISATLGAISGSTLLTVNADTTAPTIISASLDTTVTPNEVIVTMSEAVNVTQASTAANWKIADPATIGAGTCAGGTNFTGASQTGDFGISSVKIVSTSIYRLVLSSVTNSKTYTVIGSNAGGNYIRDLATTPNMIGCPNTANFIGQDLVKPYMVNVASTSSTQIQVTFSEAMTSTGGGTGDATMPANYTLTDVNGAGCATMPSPAVSSVTKVSSTVYLLTLNGSQCPITYQLKTTTLTDLSANTIGTPNSVNFTGNERIKVTSASALTTKTVLISFSKPVSADAACSTVTNCNQRFKLSDTALGNVTNAVVGAGSQNNTVTITHEFDQLGYAYTVMAANNIDGDGFNNTANTYKGIKDSSLAEYVQSAPKDRATFVGLGTAVTKIADGAYFTDPFVDGTTFSYSFDFNGKIYLGTNTNNSGAFRFDPNGANSSLISFAFSAGACLTSITFGYDSGITCGVDRGPNGERGVVGFTSAWVKDPAGSNTPHQIVIAGPLKDGVTQGYYTQDTSTTMNWKQTGFSVTGGGNTKSVQTPYAFETNFYLCMSSDHSQQAPICSNHVVSEAGGVVSVASGSDMSIRSVAELGKQGSPSNPASVVGIDSMIKFPYNNPAGKLYMGNNGGVRYSSNFTDWTTANTTSSTPAWTGTTLQLPAAPAGLGKVRPGQKGIAKFLEYNGKLYMARNVALGSSSPNSQTMSKGELWVCDPALSGVATDCEPADWSRIITGSETDLAPAKSISLLQNNGNGALYVGFDDDVNGVKIFRFIGTSPAATAGTMTSAGWAQQGNTGIAIPATDYKYIFSSASVTEGLYNYVYVIAGNGANAVRAFRQID